VERRQGERAESRVQPLEGRPLQRRVAPRSRGRRGRRPGRSPSSSAAPGRPARRPRRAARPVARPVARMIARMIGGGLGGGQGREQGVAQAVPGERRVAVRRVLDGAQGEAASTVRAEGGPGQRQQRPDHALPGPDGFAASPSIPVPKSRSSTRLGLVVPVVGGGDPAGPRAPAGAPPGRRSAPAGRALSRALAGQQQRRHLAALGHDALHAECGGLSRRPGGAAGRTGVGAVVEVGGDQAHTARKGPASRGPASSAVESGPPEKATTTPSHRFAAGADPPGGRSRNGGEAGEIPREKRGLWWR
jgi:hypothetical protein